MCLFLQGKTSSFTSINKSGSSIVIYFLFILSLISLISQSYCQPSDTWKELNYKGNRYEGVLELRASIKELELISFVAGIEDYSENDSLGVTFFLKDTLFAYIMARDIKGKKFYWMEAEEKRWVLGWNKFWPWPVTEVLNKLGINYTNLGVLVRLENKIYSDGRITPAIVFKQNSTTNIDKYDMFFLPGLPLKNIQLKVYEEFNQEKVIIEKYIGTKSSGTAFHVSLSLEDEPKGWYIFEIEYRINFDAFNIEKKEFFDLTGYKKYTFYHIIK